MKRIGMVVAVEMDALERRYGLPTSRSKGPFSVAFYKQPEYALYALYCGAGEISAASATQHLIDVYGVDMILNYGVVGGLVKKMELGKTVVVNGIVHYDYDVSSVDGVEKARYADLPSRYISPERSLVIKAQYVERSLEAVVCASGDKFVVDPAMKEMLHTEYNAEICDMEAAGIALTCARNGRPCLLIKTVSDTVSGGADEYWANKERSADLCLKVMDRVAKEL